MRAPWDPLGGRYRAPDEKTIRVVLGRLDPRALAQALLGSGPGRRSGGPPPASVRGYRARRTAQQAKTLARGRLRAVAVDGKTCRGACRADGTRVHLLGAAGHGGHLLDHLEVGVKHNETDPRAQRRQARRKAKRTSTAAERADMARSEELAGICQPLWELRAGHRHTPPIWFSNVTPGTLDSPLIERILDRLEEFAARWQELVNRRI